MRAASLLVAALAILGAGSPLWAGPFSAVPARHWAYQECGRLASLGLLSSSPGTAFSGQPELTRFEFAIAILDPLTSVDEAVKAVGPEASASALLSAAAQGLRLRPTLSEDEIAEAAASLLRLGDEFSGELQALRFDPARVSRALRALADREAVRAWRAEALMPAPRVLSLAPTAATPDALRVPLARGTVAVSLPSDAHMSDLLDYLALSASAERTEIPPPSGVAGPASGDPHISRLRTAYEYGLGPALTLSLAYEEIARRGRDLEALDAASLASVGIGYKLTPSTSVKLSYSLLDYANYVFDTPPLRDRVAETAVSIEF
jgi:hypothetical protein